MKKVMLLLAATCVCLCTFGNTYTVTNPGDNGGVNPSVNAGTGTLRQAIVNANANSGADIINFNISGSGVKTISVLTSLPAITGQVKINGYSQPGAVQGTIASRNILIAINVSFNIPAMFDIQASNTEICGIAATMTGNSGLIGSNAAQNTLVSNVFVWGNFFNTGADGNSSVGNGFPVVVYGKTNANSPYSSNLQSWIIGTDGDGSNDANEGNLFSHPPVNASYPFIEGIRLFMCDNFTIAGNTFGLKRDGLTALQTFSPSAIPSTSDNYGIAITNCTGIRIGTNGNGGV